MSNPLELYTELKNLESIVDKIIADKFQDRNHEEIANSKIETIKRWIFRWAD